MQLILLGKENAMCILQMQTSLAHDGKKGLQKDALCAASTHTTFSLPQCTNLLVVTK